MTPLQSRKQLLLAESELNRSQILIGLGDTRLFARAFAGQAASFFSIASSATSLAAGLTVLQQGKPPGPPKKTSWWEAALRVATLLVNIGLAYRARSNRQPGGKG